MAKSKERKVANLKEEKYFIRNLKNYMIEHKLSNGKMAKKMGVSSGNVTSTMNGTFDISMNFVRNACEATGMTIAELFSPDPKQFSEFNNNDNVQDGNAVAMMELMKQQIELKNQHIEALKEENEELGKSNVELMKLNEGACKELAMISEENAKLHNTNHLDALIKSKWTLLVNSISEDGTIVIDDVPIADVHDVSAINPFEKKVVIELCFDEIIIK